MMEEESRKGQMPPQPVHTPGTEKGEEVMKEEGKEPGRYDTEPTGAGRPSGKSTGRDSTGVTPEEPREPDSPHIPAP